MSERENIVNEVKGIIIAGAKSQPRSMLQVFRSFISRWEIVRIRQEANPEYNIDHRLLALMMVIQNNWPELFSRIAQYPEHLFYINALIKNRPATTICTAIELDEINNLGVSVDEKTTKNAYDVRFQRGLVRLFNAFNGEEYLNEPDENTIRFVSLHITLINERGNNPFSSSNHIWDTLLSGDPVRIFNLKRQGMGIDSKKILDLFDQYAPGRLLMLVGQLDDHRQTPNLSNNPLEIIDQVEKLIVAWGMLEVGSIHKLEEIVLKNTMLPLNLRMRCLYAIFHHAKRASQLSNPALDVILRVLETPNYHFALMEKAAYLLRFVGLNGDDLERVISIYEKFSELNAPIRDALMDSLVHAYEPEIEDIYGYADWGRKVILNMEPITISLEDITYILRKINKTGNFWPIHKFSRYFHTKIRASTEVDRPKLAYSYFLLLTQYHGEKDSRNEISSDIEKEIISELVALIPDINPKDQNNVLQETLEVQYNLQWSSSKDEWQDAWNELFKDISHSDLNGLRSIEMYSPKAVAFIFQLYKVCPDGWKADLKSMLARIKNGEIPAQAIMKDEMQRSAKEAYDIILLD